MPKEVHPCQVYRYCFSFVSVRHCVTGRDSLLLQSLVSIPDLVWVSLFSWKGQPPRWCGCRHLLPNVVVQLHTKKINKMSNSAPNGKRIHNLALATREAWNSGNTTVFCFRGYIAQHTTVRSMIYACSVGKCTAVRAPTTT